MAIVVAVAAIAPALVLLITGIFGRIDSDKIPMIQALGFAAITFAILALGLK